MATSKASKIRRPVAVERPTIGDRGMASEVIAARARAQDAQTVQLTELAPNPRNPRDVLTGIDELAADMRVQGVLQPLLVCSRSAFLAGDPGLADQIGTASWVILAGARRHAAAAEAGLDAVPVYTRDDLAGPEQASRVFQQENGQRVGLTPLQEARLLGDLRDRGHSQRTIAHQVGISPGQVAKRLKLLTLPHEAQQALAENIIDISAALALSEVDDSEVVTAVATSTARTAGERALTADDLRPRIREAQRAVWRSRTTAQLTEQGVKVLQQRPSWADRLVEVSAADVSAVPVEELKAHLSTWQDEVTYFRPRPEEAAEDPEVAPEVDPRIEQWREATAAREAFARGLLATELSRDDKAMAMKVALRLALQSPRLSAVDRLAAWMGDAWGIVGEHFHWAQNLDERFLLPAAFGYILALDEDEIHDEVSRWFGDAVFDPDQHVIQRHYARLVERGYHLAPIEADLLAVIGIAEPPAGRNEDEQKYGSDEETA